MGQQQPLSSLAARGLLTAISGLSKQTMPRQKKVRSVVCLSFGVYLLEHRFELRTEHASFRIGIGNICVA